MGQTHDGEAAAMGTNIIGRGAQQPKITSGLSLKAAL